MRDPQRDSAAQAVPGQRRIDRPDTPAAGRDQGMCQCGLAWKVKTCAAPHCGMTFAQHADEVVVVQPLPTKSCRRIGEHADHHIQLSGLGQQSAIKISLAMNRHASSARFVMIEVTCPAEVYLEHYIKARDGFAPADALAS